MLPGRHHDRPQQHSLRPGLLRQSPPLSCHERSCCQSIGAGTDASCSYRLSKYDSTAPIRTGQRKHPSFALTIRSSVNHVLMLPGGIALPTGASGARADDNVDDKRSVEAAPLCLQTCCNCQAWFQTSVHRRVEFLSSWWMAPSLHSGRARSTRDGSLLLRVHAFFSREWEFDTLSPVDKSDGTSSDRDPRRT